MRGRRVTGGKWSEFGVTRLWKETMATTKLSANFPKEELYGMTMQLRCAAVSVACNMADGAARGFDDGSFLAQVEDQRRLLLGLIRSLGLAKEGSHG
jgi:hypothetical protein